MHVYLWLHPVLQWLTRWELTTHFYLLFRKRLEFLCALRHNKLNWRSIAFYFRRLSRLLCHPLLISDCSSCLMFLANFQFSCMIASVALCLTNFGYFRGDFTERRSDFPLCSELSTFKGWVSVVHLPPSKRYVDKLTNFLMILIYFLWYSTTVVLWIVMFLVYTN